VSRLLLRLLTANFYSRMNIIKKEDSLESSRSCCAPKESKHNFYRTRYAQALLCWPRPPAAAFGTLRYPVAVDLVTLLTTSSIAARVPPV